MSSIRRVWRLGFGEPLVERGALLLERRLVAGVHLLDRGAERLQLLGELGAEGVALFLVFVPQTIDLGHDRARVTFELSLNGGHQARPKLVDLRSHLSERSSRWTATGVSWRRTPIGSVHLSALARELEESADEAQAQPHDRRPFLPIRGHRPCSPQLQRVFAFAQDTPRSPITVRHAQLGGLVMGCRPTGLQQAGRKRPPCDAYHCRRSCSPPHCHW